LRKDGAITQDLLNDPYLEAPDNELVKENADEKRIRLTKKLIKELGDQEN
jgi:ribosomal RNA-processing protein 9